MDSFGVKTPNKMDGRTPIASFKVEPVQLVLLNLFLHSSRLLA